MLAQIRKFLAAPESSQSSPDQLQIAVAVLLVEAARMDDRFDDAERAAIGASDAPLPKSNRLLHWDDKAGTRTR